MVFLLLYNVSSILFHFCSFSICLCQSPGVGRAALCRRICTILPPTCFLAVRQLFYVRFIWSRVQFFSHRLNGTIPRFHNSLPRNIGIVQLSLQRVVQRPTRIPRVSLIDRPFLAFTSDFVFSQYVLHVICSVTHPNIVHCYMKCLNRTLYLCPLLSCIFVNAVCSVVYHGLLFAR